MSITMNDLHNTFSYSNGNLIWNKSSGRAKIGDIAGTLLKSGRIAVRYKGKGYKLSRLIWMYHNGEIPLNCEIDHIDRDVLNNNISNLRCVTHTVNQRNKNANKNNANGIKNITITKHGTYRPHLKVNKKAISLGTFKTLNDAITELENAKIKYNYTIEEAS